MPALILSNLQRSGPVAGLPPSGPRSLCPLPQSNFSPGSDSQRSRGTRGSHRYSAIHQLVASLVIESMHILGVLCQVAGPREGLAAGGARVGSVPRVGAHVLRQVAGL